MRNRIFLGLIFLFGLVLLAEVGYYFFFLTSQKKAPSSSEELHTVVSKKDESNRPIVLISNHAQYEMELNSDFTEGERQSLLEKYSKEKLIFHLVDSEEGVPWDGAPQRGREFELIEGERVPVNIIMAIYEDNTINYYFYPYPKYYEIKEEKKLQLLSRTVSYKSIEALAADSRGYLFGTEPTPSLSVEEIEKYCVDNPLIIIKEK